MRRIAGLAVERVIDHISSLSEQPLHRVTGGRKLAESLREPLPELGTPIERLLKTVFGKVVPASLNTASPGYLAYIPGGGLFHSAIADFIALATNRYVGIWLASPGLVQLEQNVISWFCEILSMPSTAGGLLLSGGSMANLVAIVTARKERLPADFLRGVVYTSAEAHHSVAKAAMIAGFPTERIVSVGVDDKFRIDLRALESAIDEDRQSGLQPFCIVGNAGTTNTGAVDDLAALADIAARHSMWFHVDAAYGGFFALTSRGKRVMRGIERADSVTLDPHKGLFLPYGTGCLVVRDRAALRRAYSMHASYLPPMQEHDDLVDFCELGPELSREARGLRVWLPLKMHGAGTFRDALDEKLDLAMSAFERVRALPNVEIVSEPVLSLFTFRFRPSPHEGDEERLEAHNRAILARVNDRQRVLLTGARVGGRFFIRVCVLSFRTHADRIDALVEDLCAALDEPVKPSAQLG
ncbi:MAG: aminotransferase class I/II-fold pyridoxal phosphate-dependent enzyme [Polyangiaceae bacterium]|nr:aminotransferase class I/II-fold pyridoxal phosphate-dependent enzyme [Polyangiaceae bacterium]